MVLLCMITEKFAFSGNVSNKGIFNQQLSLIIIVVIVVGSVVYLCYYYFQDPCRSRHC